MLSRIKMTTLFLLALLVAASVPAWSQSWAGKGRLQGQVKDENGKPVQGATIILRNTGDRVDPKSDGPANVTTDKNGKWSILGLTSGGWGILIEKEGYLPSEGRLSVNEYTVAQPIVVTLKPIPKEVIQKAKEDDPAAKAKAAIERGNGLMAEGDTVVTKCKSELQSGQKFETECRSTIEKSVADYEAARAAYEEGLAKLEDKSVHPAILRAIANTYYKQNNVDQAVASLKRALEIEPNDPVTLQLLVDLLVGANREAEAKTYMDKLPQGTKVDANTLLNIGIKSFNDGKMDQALSQFDRVVKENPELPDAYYYRALVYLNQDKKAEAKADLQKLLQLDPNSKYANDAKEFLKDLK
jgi:Tfp pilus assembly protein PilF